MNSRLSRFTGFTRDNSQRGVAAVEFAIILPILIILIFGIIEFSVLLFDKAMITNAAREGARAGIVYRYNYATEAYDPLDEEEIESIVMSYCQNHLISLGADSVIDADDIDVIHGFNSETDDPTVTVQVRYQYNFLVLPNFISAITGNIILGSESIMRVE
ncbi:MAG: TadE/TadG family type IV pilus assembly protein [Dissulfuribacterales bacterium]